MTASGAQAAPLTLVYIRRANVRRPHACRLVRRHMRYCDLAGSIYGADSPLGRSVLAPARVRGARLAHAPPPAGRPGYWAVIFFQQLASIGNNLTIQIVAGQCMKVPNLLRHAAAEPVPEPCELVWSLRALATPSSY